MMEILIVVAIIGLLAGLFAIGTNSILNSQTQSPKKIFWETVNTARRTALQQHTTIHLRFDTETRTLRLTDENGEEKHASAPLPENIRIDLLGQSADGAKILLAGQAVETATIPNVRFFNDGTTQPFRAQIASNTGDTELLEIDPWTAAPILRKAQ